MRNRLILRLFLLKLRLLRRAAAAAAPQCAFAACRPAGRPAYLPSANTAGCPSFCPEGQYARGAAIGACRYAALRGYVLASLRAYAALFSVFCAAAASARLRLSRSFSGKIKMRNAARSEGARGVQSRYSDRQRAALINAEICRAVAALIYRARRASDPRSDRAEQ